VGSGRRRSARRKDADETSAAQRDAALRSAARGRRAGRHGAGRRGAAGPGARRRGAWRVRLRRYARICLAGLSGRPSRVSADVIDLVRSIAEPPCPPPGHPERAVPEIPPSRVERDLFADLIGHGRG
jgi:hypothetical protein